MTLCNVAPQVPLSMGFSRQEYWSGLLCPPAEDFPDLGVEPTSFTSLASPALADGFVTTVSPGKPVMFVKCLLKEILLEKISNTRLF